MSVKAKRQLYATRRKYVSFREILADVVGFRTESCLCRDAASSFKQKQQSNIMMPRKSSKEVAKSSGH
jgi:hypothetical protein